MNYLEIVNSTLRRIRENPVTSLYENKQSSVIAELVNDAVKYVENAHDWSHLRQDINVTTADGVSVYSLPGTQNRAKILDVRNLTVPSVLPKVPASYLRKKEAIGGPPDTSTPRYWAVSTPDSSGDMRIQLWPTPNDIYTIRFFSVVRSQELTAEGDEIVVPSQPVLMFARAMAVHERGGANSIDTEEAYTLAKKTLGEYIMLDAGLNDDELIWYPT
jgi:hypothetical protein